MFPGDLQSPAFSSCGERLSREAEPEITLSTEQSGSLWVGLGQPHDAGIVPGLPYP